MKKLSLLLIAGIAISFMFFGCQKDDPIEPYQDNLLTTELKAEKVYFEGLCQNPNIIYCGDIQVLSNGMVKLTNFESEWEDNTNDPLTTGKSHWIENFTFSKDATSCHIWGKATLTVNGGVWELSMQGQMYAKEGYVLGPPCGGPPVPCEIYARCKAVGKSGVVKGMVGEWEYTFDWNGFPAPFEYTINGWYKHSNH